MTTQEAIEILEIAKAEVEWEYPLDYSVALDIAIKELKHRVFAQELMDKLN